MNTKHTPGPWITSVDNGVTVKHSTPDGLTTHVARTDDRWICEEHGGDAASNARLIAAAPELLQACEAIRADLGSAEWGSSEHAELMFNDLIQKHHDRLQAAIAKAVQP